MGGPLLRLPLRVRITIWVVSIFAVAHVTLSLVVILLYRHSVEDRIRTDLVDAAQSVAGESAAESRLGLALQVVQGATAARWGPLACLVVDETGTMLNAAGPYEPGVLTALAEDGAALSILRGDEVFVSTDDRFIFAVAPLVGDERLVVAPPRGHGGRAIEPAEGIFIATLPVGLIAVGVTTWHMAGIAVRPLRQVQRFAEDLSAENVSAATGIDDASPEVERLRRELEGAMARIGTGYEQQARFLANISHEIKTPISVVRTEAEVLLAGSPDDAELRNFVRSTSEEMARLGRVVESFLLLTRIRQGTARIRPRRHDGNDLLMSAVGHCSAMARQYDVRLTPILDSADVPPTIEGNADLIQTALGNLIQNAIRFSPPGEPIEVSCAGRSDHAEFSIRDFGPGIPENLIARIFEPFTQADEERRRSRGNGLGLQIAQGIAELHGGEIGVENAEPGCKFTLSLPLAFSA